MDKKSKILIVVFILAIIVSIFLTYKRSFIDRDFIIIEEEPEEEVEEEEMSEEFLENIEE